MWVECQVVADGHGDANDDGNNDAMFACFPALPPELRLMVWESLIQPRVVAVASFHSRYKPWESAQLSQHPKRPAVPVLLHVNRESRALALQHYQLTFCWREPRPPPRPFPGRSDWGPDVGAMVWFNFGMDALLFVRNMEEGTVGSGLDEFVLFSLCREDMRRVRHVALAVEGAHLGGLREFFWQNCDVLHAVVEWFPAAPRLLFTSWLDGTRIHKPVPPPASSVPERLWYGFGDRTARMTAFLSGRPLLVIRDKELVSFIKGHC